MNTLKMIHNLPKTAVYEEIPSPVGQLVLIASPEGLHAILWDTQKNPVCEETIHRLKKSPEQKIILQTKQQLLEYFQGNRKLFTVPLILRGTDFQIQAWKQLQKIPYAQTVSYAEQAENIGGRHKARAVGTANGCNPLPIVIPCHRVIASNGHLGGFAGGINRKIYLLQLEAVSKTFIGR